MSAVDICGITSHQIKIFTVLSAWRSRAICIMKAIVDLGSTTLDLPSSLAGLLAGMFSYP
jgi:hypothetical protein